MIYMLVCNDKNNMYGTLPQYNMGYSESVKAVLAEDFPSYLFNSSFQNILLLISTDI